jgi:hypothetical protein
VFFLLAFGVQMGGDAIVAVGLFFGLGVVVVVLLMMKGQPEEPMKAAVAFLRGWWRDVFNETLEEREIYLVTRFYGNDEFYGGIIRRSSGSVGKKICVVIKKTQNGFAVKKARETANSDEEKNPFLGFETEYDTGAPIPHMPAALNRLTHRPPEKPQTQVIVGDQHREEDKD